MQSGLKIEKCIAIEKSTRVFKVIIQTVEESDWASFEKLSYSDTTSDRLTYIL
jgi:hypothetical protein